jgi:hypothetical protein
VGHREFASPETIRNDAKAAIERIASGALTHPQKLLNHAMPAARGGSHFFPAAQDTICSGRL